MITATHCSRTSVRLPMPSRTIGYFSAVAAQSQSAHAQTASAVETYWRRLVRSIWIIAASKTIRSTLVPRRTSMSPMKPIVSIDAVTTALAWHRVRRGAAGCHIYSMYSMWVGLAQAWWYERATVDCTDAISAASTYSSGVTAGAQCGCVGRLTAHGSTRSSTRTSGVATATVPYSGHRRLNAAISVWLCSSVTPLSVKVSCTELKRFTSGRTGCAGSLMPWIVTRTLRSGTC